MKPSILLSILIYFSFLINSKAGGILAWKAQHYHPDSSAKISRYDTYRFLNQLHHITLNGRTVKLSGEVICLDLPHPLDSPTVTCDNDLHNLLIAHGQITDFGKRFPHSNKIIQPHLTLIKEKIDRYQGGEILVANGVWKNKRMLAKEKEQQKIAELKEKQEKERLDRLREQAIAKEFELEQERQKEKAKLEKLKELKKQKELAIQEKELARLENERIEKQKQQKEQEQQLLIESKINKLLENSIFNIETSNF